MPFQSAKQKRYIYFQASQGTPWARKFLKDSGVTDLPPVKHAIKRVRKRRKHAHH